MTTERPATRTYFGVQALRAVAALGVVVHHALSAWRERLSGDPHGPPLWENGMSGVDVFFVISGFVMAASTPALLGGDHPGWTFLRRRLIRIVPLYWIFTTVRLLKLTFGVSMPDQSLGSAWHVIASYLFIPSLDANHAAVPLLGVGWTLNFEMMFYLLFTVALVARIYPLAFLLPTLSLVAAVGWFAPVDSPLFPAFASPLVLEFLFGIVLAHFTLRSCLPHPWLGALLLIGGCAVILTVHVPLYKARAFYWGVPAAAIVTGVVALEDRLGRRLPRWLLEAGNASYATYLTHGFVLSVVWVVLARFHRQPAPMLFTELMLLSLVSTLGVGEIVHRVIELPLMNLFRGRRVRGVSVLPA